MRGRATTSAKRWAGFLLTFLALTGCQSTFDERGNLRAPRGPGHAHPYQPTKDPVKRFIAQRTLQLWEPAGDGKDEQNEAVVSQGAFITADGYALATGHSFDDGPAYSLHPNSHPDTLPRVVAWDKNGIQFDDGNGGTRLETAVQLHPVRVVHRFEAADLVLIHIPSQLQRSHFETTETPPKRNDSVSIGLNPIIHPELPGLTARVTRIDTKPSPSWTFQIEAAATFGDSGGPVLNASGTLMGLITGGNMSLLTPGKSKRVYDVTAEGLPASEIQNRIAKDRQTNTAQYQDQHD